MPFRGKPFGFGSVLRQAMRQIRAHDDFGPDWNRVRIVRPVAQRDPCQVAAPLYALRAEQGQYQAVKNERFHGRGQWARLPELAE